MFADDLVGVSEPKDQLQKLIDGVHAYVGKWRLKAKVSMGAVMVFAWGISIKEDIKSGMGF